MQETKNKLSFWQFVTTLQWLFAFNFRLSPFVVVSRFITSVFLQVSPILNAYIFARLLDGVIKLATTGTNPYEIIPLLGMLLAYDLIASGVSYVDEYFQNVMSDLVQFKAPQLYYRHINSLGIQTLENPEMVNKIQRSREVLGVLNNDFDRSISFFGRIVTLFSALLVVLHIMPIVVLVVFFSIIPGLVSNRFHMRKSWQLYRSETENKRRASFVFSSLTETSNLQEGTITSAYDYLSGLYKKFADRYMIADLKNIKNWQFFGFLFGSITSTASIFGYFSILKNLFEKTISVGNATFQMSSLDIFINNVTQVGNTYVSLYERCTRINEIKEVFDTKPMVHDGMKEMPSFEYAPNISFDNVSFKYPGSDNYILENLNLEIKEGEKIAIVGENGAGKTTLVKLLSRFYKVSEGVISLSGVNVNDIKIDRWYDSLSVLFQDYNTYSALTLRENIYLGKSRDVFDREAMTTAAARANIDSFIEKYKNGYEQILSEKFKGGVRPSTGQWQKIAIARFFYRNSPVVIFDEPTASIDAVSESEIFGQIYNFFKNKTVIIISHRFSTVRNADKIYVLDGGTIVESGSHDELIKKKGRYYNAFTIQAKGYK
ncbi:MAG: ABC transporter ATP-binding protein [Candidatus Paceibacterota bacterium]|jgi:ATP-binding cassette subfamily B protein